MSEIFRPRPITLSRSKRDVGHLKHSFKRYVKKVFRKNIGVPISMSTLAKECVANFMTDLFEKLADKASLIVEMSARRTLTESDIKGAVKIIMDPKLATHCNYVGKQALHFYAASFHE